MTGRTRCAVAATATLAAALGSAGPAGSAGSAGADAYGTTTTRISVRTDGTQVYAASSQPSLSADGRWVAFVSGGRTLVPGDTNLAPDVFLRDRATGTTRRVSLTAGGGQGNGRSDLPSLSRDGRYVAFYSEATNLVPGDTNGRPDVFLRDVVAGTTRRVSVAVGGGQPDGDSVFPAVSDDGRYVAFASAATNLVNGDGNGLYDVFVRDLAAGTTRRMSVSSTGAGGNGASLEPAISGDGSVVAFVSEATNLVPGDTAANRDLFVRVRAAGTTERVSVGTGDESVHAINAEPALSRDGRYVAFDSSASDLVPGDTNGFQDVFLRDRAAGTTELVSRWPAGTPANRLSTAPDVSADGQVVVFDSLVGDAGSLTQVYRRDRATGVTRLASVSPSGQPGNDHSSGAAVSPDGRHVGFTSSATDLVRGDTNGQQDVFVRH